MVLDFRSPLVIDIANHHDEVDFQRTNNFGNELLKEANSTETNGIRILSFQSKLNSESKSLKFT